MVARFDTLLNSGDQSQNQLFRLNQFLSKQAGDCRLTMLIHHHTLSNTGLLTWNIFSAQLFLF